jgi:hypothetical protein
MDEIGFDGVGFNEHHTSPYGLMTSSNIRAAAAAQRTRRLKLLIYGNITEAQLQQQRGYLSANPHDYVRPEYRAALSGERSRDMTLADLERNQALPWGRPEEGQDKLIAEAEGVGTNTLLLNFNRGAMPHAMFIEQLHRFGAEVLPALPAHQVTKVPM